MWIGTSKVDMRLEQILLIGKKNWNYTNIIEGVLLGIMRRVNKYKQSDLKINRMEKMRLKQIRRYFFIRD